MTQEHHDLRCERAAYLRTAPQRPAAQQYGWHVGHVLNKLIGDEREEEGDQRR